MNDEQNSTNEAPAELEGVDTPKSRKRPKKARPRLTMPPPAAETVLDEDVFEVYRRVAFMRGTKELRPTGAATRGLASESRELGHGDDWAALSAALHGLYERFESSTDQRAAWGALAAFLLSGVRDPLTIRIGERRMVVRHG
jgi:hypothetical protein